MRDFQPPNLYLVGAPKCATTSIYDWLCTHPDVYVPAIKEPHHFNTDAAARTTPERADYEALYEGARGASAVLDASVWYLLSKTAVSNILDYNPDARFVAMVRNPLEMAPALHEEHVFNRIESHETFAEAWAAQERRAQGQDLPALCRNPEQLLYGAACSLGAQLERLFARVPAERRLVIVLDDLRDNPQREYQRLLDFAGVDPTVLPEFAASNAAKARRWPALATTVKALGRLKRLAGLEHRGFGVLEAAKRVNRRERPRSALPDGLRQELAAYFRDDIALLGRLLDRDLSAWLAPAPGSAERDGDPA